MHPIILGITGDHNTGKTTLAQLLETHCNARVLQFSDGIYAEVAKAFSVSIIDLAARTTKNMAQPLLALHNCADKAFVQRMQEIYASGLREGGTVGEVLDLAAPRTPRQILEWWGSEYRRTQNPDYWVDQAQARINLYLGAGCTRPFVLADVYKHNEADMVRAMHGTIWRLEWPGHEQRTAHPTSTEHLQIKADLTLTNAGDIPHLQHLALTQWHELLRAKQAQAEASQHLFNRRNCAVLN